MATREVVGKLGEISKICCAGTSLYSDLYIERVSPFDDPRGWNYQERSCQYCGTSLEKRDSKGNCISCGAPVNNA